MYFVLVQYPQTKVYIEKEMPVTHARKRKEKKNQYNMTQHIQLQIL